jgi:phosphoribosylformylglycinamidine synthase
MFIAKITVRLKKGVSDPEGANTLKALHLLGFDKIKEAKTIRIFELLIDSNDKNQVQNDVEKMCQRLLTNPVIHNYSVEIKEE